MKCSLKYDLINILLIIFIAPSEGIEYPLFLHGSPVLDKPMNLHQFRASINRLQDLDSFPGICESRLHRIVKKQMSGSDFGDENRNKRAVVSSPEIPVRFARGGAGDGADVNSKDDEKEEEAVNKSAFLKARSATTESFLKKLKEFAKEKESFFLKGSKKPVSPFKVEGKSGTGTEEDQIQPLRQRKNKLLEVMRTVGIETEKLTNDKGGRSKYENSNLSTKLAKIPDQFDYRYYYECEIHPNGCLKLTHKSCPRGEFFSDKFLRCFRVDRGENSQFRRKKTISEIAYVRKPGMPDPGPDDMEPANEWLDANQGAIQKIPSEFKPKKKPCLKIYHIREKRTSGKGFRKEVQDQEWDKLGVTRVNGKQVAGNSLRDSSKTRETKPRRSRSFAVRLNRKEGKGDQITESNENENDSDEDDEEADGEDDDEETDEEDEDDEDEDPKEMTQEKPRKDTLRDLFRSAKEAVTNRARFEDPTQTAPRGVKEADRSSLKSKKSDDSTAADKKVLIDANIKVDSTLGSVFRSLLKHKKKDLESNKMDESEGFVSDRESQDKLDPELLRTYENLMRNNPRVKRYFLVNCSARRN